MMFSSHGFCVGSHYSIHKSRCGMLNVSVGGFAIVHCGHNSANILVQFFSLFSFLSGSFKFHAYFSKIDVAGGFPLEVND